MNKIFIITLNVLGFLLSTTGQAVAMVKLNAHMSTPPKKISKYKNSGDLYLAQDIQIPKKNISTMHTKKNIKVLKLKIALAVTPKISETCPTSIKFNGKITASKAGTVKYKILGKDGEKRWMTPTKLLKFNKAGAKQISQWTHSYHKPDTSKSLAIKGSDGPKAVKGKARIIIVEKSKNTVVTGGAATYDIWCDGRPKRKKEKPKTFYKK